MAAILVKLPWPLIQTFVPLPRSLALIGHAVAEKMFKYYSHIHVYIPPQAGADNHPGLNVFIKINLPICIIIASFHPFNYI